MNYFENDKMTGSINITEYFVPIHAWIIRVKTINRLLRMPRWSYNISKNVDIFNGGSSFNIRIFWEKSNRYTMQ